ncbi:MAG: nucleotidyltransferase family protein [Firmicutes bacterium]|nr:nucleotidyltransferase family protein [Bacillota bacterium]
MLFKEVSPASLSADAIWRAFHTCGTPFLVLTGDRQQNVPLLKELEETVPFWAQISDLQRLGGVHVSAQKESAAHDFHRPPCALLQRKDMEPAPGSALSQAFFIDLQRPFGNAGCILMASGMGKRFGGNKLLADFRGKPLIEHAIDMTEGLFAEVLVVTRHTEIEAICRRRQVPVLLHQLPLRSDTVRLGIETIGPSVDRCAFLPADQPLLSSSTLQALLLSAAAMPACIWRPAFEGSPGSPVIFPSDLFSDLAHLPEGKGGSAVAKAHPQRVRLLPVPCDRELKDVDTKEDLEELGRLSFK